MDVKSELRNKLVRKIQKLPKDKLNEVNELLIKIEKDSGLNSKPKNLAGSWKDLDEDLFTNLTSKLHENRAIDRQNRLK